MEVSTSGETAAPAGAGVLWRDELALVLFGISAVGVLVFGLVPHAYAVLSVTAWLVIGWLQWLQVRLCLAAARIPGMPRSTRRFWRLFAGAAAAFCLASVAQVAEWLAGPDEPDVITGGIAHHVILALGAVFLIGALLSSPLGLATGRERLRFWLDAATVLVAVALFAWQLTDVESSARSGDSLVIGFGVSLIGPAAFLVVAFGALKILLGGSAPFTPLAGVIGMGAAAIEGGVTGLAGPLMAADRGSWLLGLAVLANTGFALAIRAHLLQVRTDGTALQRRKKRPYSRLPYVTIVLTYALLVQVLIDAGLTGQAWVVLGGAILSTGIVVARQLVSFADNEQLVRRLHDALAERDELAGRLHHQAFHDNLTGLANRAMFLQRLTAELDRARGDGSCVAVMIIDLDDFKPVNDRFGHAAGDALLREVAARLTGCVGDAGLVARLGGDEFGVLLARPEPRDLAELPDLIVAAVREPVSLGGERARIGASVGLACTERGGRQVGDLLHEADLAMYAHKQRVKATAA
ncbi:MAG TPA: GGDEF domain-containing protein [Micromonosporaceae bacterium]|nr:GGDEF domain-containing protein [Micromonosporaceae bacterium]